MTAISAGCSTKGELPAVLSTHLTFSFHYSLDKPRAIYDALYIEVEIFIKR